VTTNEPAAPAGQNRPNAGETRPVLLAAFGGESSDAAAVWGHAGTDSGAPVAGGVGEPQIDPPGAARVPCGWGC